MVFTRLAARARRNSGARRLHWLCLASLIGGGTIWVTHFVAMLGFDPHLDHAYAPIPTLGSLAVAVSMTALATAVVAFVRNGPGIELGGGVLGLGIAAMHFIGVAALRLPGQLVLDTPLVLAALLAAVCFGALTMNRLARPVTRFCRFGSALALAAAILGTHGLGMAAITIAPDPTLTVPAQLIGDGIMAGFVIVVLGLLTATGFSSYMIDHHASGAPAHGHGLARDPLTALPTRNGLARRLADMTSGTNGTARIAIHAIGLDGLDDIRDVHGRAAIDQILKALSERLAGALGPDMCVARLDGDNFVAVGPGVYTRAQADAFARTLQDLISAPIRCAGASLCLEARQGVSMFPDDAILPDALLACADTALEHAGSHGHGPIVFYAPAMDEVKRDDHALAMDLRHAVERDELELHYQVQYQVGTGDMIGFEVLLRWNHSARGPISPARFIPLALENDLILEIGEWVLRAACAEAARWHHPYPIAVNIAARQLDDDRLPRLVHEILLQTGLPASRLQLEITESGIIEDRLQALHVIRRLKALGTTIVMDDYGTGYSSLSTLKDIPFDRIKIDRGFIADIATDPQSAAIVKATILLADSLHIPVLAEGVEDEAQLEWLTAAGCHQVQGFLFGRPVPASQIQNLVGRDAPQTSPPIVAPAPAHRPRRARAA